MATRQQELQSYNEFEGQKTYKFVLTSVALGVYELKNNPEGWLNGQTRYTRNKRYKSVLRKSSVNILTFVLDGMDYIKTVYAIDGDEGDIELEIFKLDTATYEYVSYPSANKLDLSTYEISKDGVTVQLIDNNFLEKVKSNESTDINLLSLESIRGFEITDNIDNELDLPAANIEATADYEGDGTEGDEEHIIPITLISSSSEFSETQTPSGALFSKDSGYYRQSTTERDLNLSGTLKGSIVAGSEQPSLTLRIRQRIINDAGGTVSDGVIAIIIGNFVSELDFELEIDHDFSVITDQTAIIYGENPDYADSDVVYSENSLILKETIQTIPAITINGFLIYEAFLRILQHYTDSDNPLKSVLFGRTDTPFTVYGQDGEIAFMTKGIFIRQASLLTHSLNENLATLFDAANVWYNIGLGYEVIGGADKIVIEEEAYFYKTNVLMDLSGQVNDYLNGKLFNADKSYNEIKTGYQKALYETIGGLSEYNTKSTWTTIKQNVNNVLNLVSNIRGDTQGIRLLMGFPILSSGDTDVKGEDDKFLIDTVRDGLDFLARTSEGFDFVQGGIDADQSLNLNKTPKRILLKHGTTVTAALLKKLNTYIRWQNTDKNTTLQTRLSTEATNVVENADELVNNLDKSRILPDTVKFKAVLTASQIAAYDVARHDMIKFGDDLYGWVEDMKTGNSDGETEFKVSLVNLNEVVPT